MLKLGNSNINKAYLGSTEIKKMYLGDTIVFDSSSSTYDPDFQAWIDYNIAQGHYITSDTVKLDAANQYVIDSKSDGTWQGKDVDFIFAWNDLNMADASLVCLKRLIKVDVYGGCTYTVNGWEGNGVDGYIDPLFNPFTDGVNYTLNDAGRGFVNYQINGSGSKVFIGSEGSGSIFTQLMYVDNTVNHRINSSVNGLNSTADLTGVGLKTMYRDNDTDVRLYNQSTEMLRITSSLSAHYDLKMYLFRANNVYTNAFCSYLYFSKSFTQSENESIRTNLNTYLSAIGLTPYA